MINQFLRRIFLILSLMLGHQIPVYAQSTLVYRVKSGSSGQLELGTFSITFYRDLMKAVRVTNERDETSILYLEGMSVFRESSTRSDFAEIWPRESSGRIHEFPCFPPETLPVVSIKKDKVGNFLAPLMDAVVQGHLYYEPARLKTSGSDKDLSFEVLYQGKIEALWTFSGFRLVDGISIPVKISRYRYKASGLNIKSDDHIEWNLENTFKESSDVFKPEKFLPQQINIQSYLDQDSSFTFTFYESNGSLDDQLKLARSNHNLETPKKENWSKFLFYALFAISGIGIAALVIRKIASKSK